MDNCATHKHEKALARIERKKRIFLHFIPTSAPWANLVEPFFAILAQKQIRRGTLTSVPHLEKCVREYLQSHNENPLPLVWTKKAGGSLKQSIQIARRCKRHYNHHFVRDTTLVNVHRSRDAQTSH